MNIKRFASSIVVALASLTVVTDGAPTVSAAIEVTSFEQTPGIVRTNISAALLDVDVASGLVYVVTDPRQGAQRILAIDPGPAESAPITPFDTVDVVREAAITGGGRVVDLDVSRDGRTIVVSRTSDITIYDRSTLAVIATRSIARSRVAASPAEPQRLLAFGGTRSAVIVDGSDVIDLADTVDPADGRRSVVVRPPYTWGTDSDTVIGRVDGRPAKIAVADPPELLAIASTDSTNVTSASVQGESLVFGNGVFDLDTLDFIGFIGGADPVTTDNVGSIVVSEPGGASTTWSTYDSTDLTNPQRAWQFPFTQQITEDVGVLPGGRLAVIERGSTSSNYLTIADPERLAGPYGEFNAVQPVRVLDTRTGEGRGGVTGKLGEGEEITVDLAGEAGLPAEGVLAVVLNATVAAPTDSSFFSIWPSGRERPEVSNLNFGPGQTLANFVTIALGDDGAIRLSNEFGNAHGILDVVGYYSSEAGEPGARYTPVSSSRLLDTRPANGGRGRIAADGIVTIDIGSVPTPVVSGVTQRPTAVAVNVTAVQPDEAGFLSVWPSGSPRPTASSLNFSGGETRANLVVVGVGEGDQSIQIYTSGRTHLLVDVFGVYEYPDRPRLDQQGKLLPIEPFRSFDSRLNSPYDPPGRVPENRSIIFGNYFGWTDIWNVTAVRPTADGFLSVLGYDSTNPDTDVPQTSNVNFSAGETVANGVYAFGAPDTELYNPFGETHVVVDRFGYLTPAFQRSVNEVWNPA